MFAAMRIRSNVLDGRMREQDDAEGAHMLVKRLCLASFERLIPADVHEDLDTSIEFE